MRKLIKYYKILNVLSDLRYLVIFCSIILFMFVTYNMHDMTIIVGVVLSSIILIVFFLRYVFVKLNKKEVGKFIRKEIKNQLTINNVTSYSMCCPICLNKNNINGTIRIVISKDIDNLEDMIKSAICKIEYKLYIYIGITVNINIEVINLNNYYMYE